jgi:hypothetical protein
MSIYTKRSRHQYNSLDIRRKYSWVLIIDNIHSSDGPNSKWFFFDDIWLFYVRKKVYLWSYTLSTCYCRWMISKTRAASFFLPRQSLFRRSNLFRSVVYYVPSNSLFLFLLFFFFLSLSVIECILVCSFLLLLRTK